MYNAGFIASLYLIAVGAILALAVTEDVSGVDVGMAGGVLIVVGVVGFLWSIVLHLGYNNRDIE